MALTHALSTNNYGPSHLIVSSWAANGTHTTIAGALADAVSGDTIFIRTGVYTENLTLVAGVNLTAYQCDASTFLSTSATTNVTIIGKCTATFTGNASFSGINFQTNSDYAISITGTNVTNLFFTGCNLNGLNNTIVQNTSSGDGRCYFYYCTANLDTTGIAYFSNTHGDTQVVGGSWVNDGGSSTASTVSGGGLTILNCNFYNPVSLSNGVSFACRNVNIDLAGVNTTCVTLAGTSSVNATTSTFQSGSASCISTGSGCTSTLHACTFKSSNTNALTGAGTTNYSLPVFSGTSRALNVTTQTDENAGTWTPTIVGGSVAGSTTYVAQNGYYVRIGSLVFVQGLINISAATGTGDATIGGLPFTVKNQTNGYPAGAIYLSGSAGWTFPAGRTYLTLIGLINTLTASIGTSGTAVGGTNLQMANASAQFYFSLCYIA